MLLIQNKNVNKGISLFIKISILFFSSVYIYKKLQLTELNKLFEFNTSNLVYLIIALLMVVFNWGIEAAKWKLLINKIESISLTKSLQSVICGVSIGLFTPNRVGEFVGRVLYLDNTNKPEGYKIQATLISFVGSGIQFFITIVAGIIAAALLYSINDDYKLIIENIFSKKILLLTFAVFLIVGSIIYLFKNDFVSKYQKYTEYVFKYNFKELGKITFYSIIRYFVFTAQYFFVLKYFNVDAPFYLFATTIALTFFTTTLIPTFALSELTVRGSSAILFMQYYISNVSIILSASIILWIINIALPAIIGYYFVWRLKFFKESEHI